jgi:hypothetical protein
MSTLARAKNLWLNAAFLYADFMAATTINEDGCSRDEEQT